MDNLHNIAVAALRQKHADWLLHLAKSHFDWHVECWKAFYEGNPKAMPVDYACKRSPLTPLQMEVMQEFVDKGLAPTPAQVGANPAILRWGHLAYRNGIDTLKAWSRDLGFRIEAAIARTGR